MENSVRPLALDRKNHLSAGSHDAAQRIVMMNSFFASCRKQDINPFIMLAYHIGASSIPLMLLRNYSNIKLP